MTDLPTPEAIGAKLAALRAERGYLLPHHGALAAAAPDLHDAYGRMYAALTLTERHLTPLEKEFVWLAILAAMRESVGTHHLDLFARAGGSEAQARVAFLLAGYAGAGETLGFAEQHWQAQFPGLEAARAYREGTAKLCGETVPPLLAALALAAVHTALGHPWGLRVQIRAAYEQGEAEDKLVESLALTIWPAGVNKFLDACAEWRALMLSGAVAPSPRYRAWAEAPGQGAFVPPA